MGGKKVLWGGEGKGRDAERCKVQGHYDQRRCEEGEDISIVEKFAGRKFL